MIGSKNTLATVNNLNVRATVMVSMMDVERKGQLRARVRLVLAVRGGVGKRGMRFYIL